MATTCAISTTVFMGRAGTMPAVPAGRRRVPARVRNARHAPRLLVPAVG
jgi:hypothetical protein